MHTPDHLICDPLPSDEEAIAATFVLRLKRPASLWRFPDDDENQGTCIRIFDPLPDDVSALEMARVAREVGDFIVEYHRQTDDLLGS